MMPFCGDLFEGTVVEGNCFAKQFINSETFPLRSAVRQWASVTVNEIYVCDWIVYSTGDHC
jgi:hypothetical protein